MKPNRRVALDHLEQFLLVDRTFPPLFLDRRYSRDAVTAARAMEQHLAGVPGWKPQTFARAVLPSATAAAVYTAWLAAYLAGLDAGVRSQPPLIESKHGAHRERWILAYDLGERLRAA